MELDDRTQPRLTEFGTHLHELMLSRGLRTLAELSRLLEQKSHHVSRQTLSTYAIGKRAVPASFLAKLVAALELDEEEKRDLAWAFAYGQG